MEFSCVGMKVAIPPLCFTDLQGIWCTIRLGSAKCVSQVSYAQIIAAEGVAGWRQVQGPMVVGELRKDYSFRLLKPIILCETICA